jgi:colicin import membrane protein
MNPQSPGAYLFSALIHGAVALLVLFFCYAANNVVQEAPKVFELVAGAGDNYAATEAPALGSPGGIKLAQAMPQADPAPSPPAPIQEAPPETAPTAAAAPVPAAQPKPSHTPKAAKPLDMVSQLKRVEMRREANLERKYQKEQEAERKRITQEEFQRQQAAAKAGKVSHIDAEGIREGVIGGSAANRTGGAGGRALTREEGSELDAYFSLLKARIKENHVPPEGVSDTLEARVEFYVAADGSLSRIRIERSSGNHEFDRSVIEACEHTRSIGPRPDGRSETVQMTFKMHEDESS